MKPPEILGMIEEAAGTRMFEQKKQSALKTITKKQIKVGGWVGGCPALAVVDVIIRVVVTLSRAQG